jgi:hypothetical protein
LEGDRQKLARDGDTRLVRSSDLQMLVLGTKLRIGSNGGRDRLAADLLIERLGGEPFSWDDGSLTNVGELHARYVTALRAADNRNIGPLLNFARSKRAQEFSHVNRITLESFPRWIWCCRLGLSLQGGGNCISSHQGPSNVPAARNLMPSPLPGHHIPFTENKP